MIPPITILRFGFSPKRIIENNVPNTASIDNMIADFVSSTCFCAAVCRK